MPNVLTDKIIVEICHYLYCFSDNSGYLKARTMYKDLHTYTKIRTKYNYEDKLENFQHRGKNALIESFVTYDRWNLRPSNLKPPSGPIRWENFKQQPIGEEWS